MVEAPKTNPASSSEQLRAKIDRVQRQLPAWLNGKLERMQISLLHCPKRAEVQVNIYGISALYCLIILSSIAHCQAQDSYVSKLSRLGLKLSQHSKLNGDYQIFVNQKGLKIVGTKTSLMILSKAPYRQVTIANLKTKRFCLQNNADFKNDLAYTLGFFGAQSLSVAPLVKYKTVDFKNNLCNIWKSAPKFADDAAQLRRQNAVDSSYAATFELLVLPFRLAPSQEKILATFCSVPRTGGIPLELTADCFDKKKRIILNTVAIEQRQILDSEFELLPGLKEVLRASDVNDSGAEVELMH